VESDEYEEEAMIGIGNLFLLEIFTGRKPSKGPS